MCERHSFCVARGAKVLDGFGLTESHTAIMQMHGLSGKQHDTCNLYEWQPPKGWPDASYADGLRIDCESFETKQRHEDAIQRHVLARYPDRATWDAPDAIRWSELPLPDAERVQRAYELALRAAPLAWIADDEVLTHVNRHLAKLGCKEAVKVASVASVWDSVRDSVWASVWASVRDSVRASVRDSVRDSVWASVWASVWDSVWASVWASAECAMVREDADNPWLPLAELATHGVYLYGVTDDGTAYVIRGEKT